MRGRNFHDAIRRRIETRLDGRSWSWLSQAAGIPQSTLATQLRARKFSLESMVGISKALGCTVDDLLFGPSLPDSQDQEMGNAG